MNRIPGILFHKLKGSPGWSSCCLSKLDVAKIISIDYRKRLFCLIDWEKPYVLDVEYHMLKTFTSVAPTTGGGTAYYQQTTHEQLITKRYESEEAVQREISVIQSKMAKLDKLAQNLAKELLDGITDDEEDCSVPTTKSAIAGSFLLHNRKQD